MWYWEVRILLSGTYNHHRARSLTTRTDIQKHQRSPCKTTKTPAEMLAIWHSAEIITRKDDCCRGRTIKSLFREITANQRQHSSLCYRHTLPYRHPRSEVCISAGSDHNQAKGHHLYRMACPPERLPTWTTRLYWNFRCELVLEDGLILKNDRSLIQKQLRRQVLDVIHLAHQGETKRILLAREAVFWPVMNSDIREMVKGCEACNKHQPAHAKLPIRQTELRTRQWEKLGTDIFDSTRPST